MGVVQVGIKLALVAANALLAPKVEGPRLDSLGVTTADYGTPLVYFWGKRRLEGCPIIWAEKLREKKTTSKTKGGKYAEYKYFGTFAVAIADHQIDAVSRIWLDKHLCYDITKAGPISVLGGFFQGSERAAVKLTRGRNMRIYDGTQTGPDPRMEAWCEDRYGADSCPSYKDVSYIVFEDLPLEKFGNRIPQITVEAVHDSSTNFLYETIIPAATLFAISKDHTRLLFYATNGAKTLDLWDIPTRQRLLQTTFANIPDSGLDMDASGQIWSTGGTLGDTLRCFAENGALLVAVPTGAFTEDVFCVGAKVCMRPYAGAATQLIIFSPGGTTGVVIDTTFCPDMYFEDLDGGGWAIGTVGTTLYLYDIINGAEYSIPTPGAVSGVTAAIANPDGNFFVLIGSTVCIVDPATMTVLDSAVISGVSGDSRATAKFTPPGTALFWGNEKEINTATLEVTQTISLGDWTSGNTSQQWYLQNLHALLGDSIGDPGVTIRYLDRVGSDGTQLADVVSDVADMCAVAEVDVSDLDQTVTGYSVTQGSGKDMIAPLLDIHDVDARPHDFAVQFLVRGDAPVGTINVSAFVREGDEARYTISIAQDTDLPKQISLSFADGDKDQQTNTVLFQRPNVSSDSVRNQQIDLTTYVSTPGDAQKFVDRFGRRKWNGRETVSNSLTSQYLGLEPGDVWTLALDDVSQSARLTKLTISGNRLNTEWERDFASLHLLGTGTGAEMDGRDDDELYIPAPTKGLVLDIPLVRDSHELSSPQLYYAAGSYGGDWPGAVMFQNDAGEYFPWNAVESADKATWGYATDALPAANPWVWDRGNSINVNAFGTLTSSTEAAILASPLTNLAYLGGELLNFTTATLESDGTYTLSGLLRGRRGTEWACDGHASGDEFALVSSLERDGMGLSDVGLDFQFKAQTLGRDAISAPTINVEYTGATLKPYAPANLKAVRDGVTGDWAITGKRRTRVGGAWIGGTPIPLSEASEDYEVVILDGATETRLLDVTIDGDGNFSATYSSANQTTDFGSVQSAIAVQAYQLSDAIGRGFPATLDGTSTGEILTGTITAGLTSLAVNADVTPVNPSHTAGDTLLCVVMLRGSTATLACATSGWAAADGISNPTALNGSLLYLFQNECATDAEPDPEITCSGGSGSETVIATVLRIPGRDTAANFGLGTVSPNASNSSTIAFAQNSPSIDDGNAIIAIGVKNNNPIVGSDIGILTGQAAGLDWTHLVAFDSSLGNDVTLGISYAYNDSGSAYTAGTGATMSATYSVGAISAAVYLEVPLT